MEHEGFEVEMFLAPVSRLCADVYDSRNLYPELEFAYVKNNDEVRDQFIKAKSKGFTCFLMNACPIILNEKVLDVLPVYNIHPGDIHYNRGHQPHLWTVLSGDEKSKIVLHSVGVGIDEGDIFAASEMAVDDTMDAGDVLDRLEDRVPILLDGLYDHLTKGTPPIDSVSGGGYRRVMTHEDYMFDVSDITNPGFKEDVTRKIRARSMNHGAFFIYEGERVYVDRLLYDEPVKSTDAAVSFHGSVTFVEKDGIRYVFNVNKREKIV